MELPLRDLLKIYSSSQRKEWDRYHLATEGMSEVELVEQAALYLYNFMGVWDKIPVRFDVFCGSGNNGADGLAIARLMRENGYNVSVMLLKDPKECSPTFQELFAKWRKVSEPERTYFPDEPLPIYEEERPTQAITAIDALFGFGINRPPEDRALELIQHINRVYDRIASIDLPSGMPGDPETFLQGEFDPNKHFVRANEVLVIQRPHLSLLLRETGQHAQKWSTIDVDLSPDFDKLTDTPYFWFTSQSLWVRKENVFLHKNERKKLLIIGGSQGMLGAPILTAEAAFATGIGIAKLATVLPAQTMALNRIPELMICPGNDIEHLRTLPDPSDYGVIAIGPGLGQHPKTAKAFRNFLSKVNVPIVIDADALNLCATFLQKDPSFRFPNQTILTPHPKEFDRLWGAPATNAWERLQNARNFAQKHHLVVVLKGAYSATCLPTGAVIFNCIAQASLATAGMGDVLTGVIAALLCRHHSLEEAAAFGTFIHSATSFRNDIHFPPRATYFIHQIPSVMAEFSKEDLESWTDPNPFTGLFSEDFELPPDDEDDENDDDED